MIRPLLAEGGAVAAAPPSRLYYGWVLVGVLGVSATISYGILTYAFAVFIAPMQAELGWSKAAITGAFSLATLVAGLAALPVGRWVDRHGARSLMTAGSVLASALLLAWAHVESLAGFYAVWVGLGVAMAAVLYEPAFAVLAVWFRAKRGRALTGLTFLGGFASVVFVPLAAVWVEAYGWRGALVRLALVQVATIPLHGLLLRRRPEDVGAAPDGEGPVAVAAGHAPPPERSVPGRRAVRSPSFRWVTVCFGLSALATTAVSVHLVPLLLERGYPATFAGAAMGVLGLMALPGRLVFTPLGDRWPRGVVTASIFALQAGGTALLLWGHGAWAVWAFVGLFGAGFGAITPARAALVAELYGPAEYGRISGVLALLTSLARAAAPVGASLLYSAGGGYGWVSAAVLAVCLGSAGAVLRAERPEPSGYFMDTPQ
jgi:MFS family permease